MYSRASGGANYIDYLVPGVVSMSILFTAVFSGLEVIWDRQFGFLKETLVAPISRTEIMVGKTLGGAAIAMIQGLIVLSLSYVLGFRISNLSSLGFGLIFMFLIAIFFSGLGLTIASRMKDMHGFQLIMNFLIMPIFFLSGALFPLKDLPPAIYFISMIDPLTYGVDGLRGVIAGISTFAVYSDLLVMGLLSALICAIGTVLFSGIEA
jgi:ABC-2 type transport system permease protein